LFMALEGVRFVGADRKGPLAAFVVVTIIAAVLLVTSVRSQAAPGIFGRSFPVTILAGPSTAGLWDSAGHHADQAVHQGMVLAHKAVEPVVSDDASTDTAAATVSDARPPSIAVRHQPRVQRLHAGTMPHLAHPARDHHSHAGPTPAVDQPADQPGNQPGDQPGDQPGGTPADGPSEHAGDSAGEHSHGKGEDHHGRGRSEDGDQGRHHTDDGDTTGDNVSETDGDTDGHTDGDTDSDTDGDTDGDGDSDGDSEGDSTADAGGSTSDDGDVVVPRGRHLGWAKHHHHHARAGR